MKILYSFNKSGREAKVWADEIGGASFEGCSFIPFNHDPYLDINRYIRAQLLDNLFDAGHPQLRLLYDDLQRRIEQVGADVLLVDNCPPYHPEFLRKLPIYKVLRVSDGPIRAYDRDFAYVHAYDQVLYHSPAYSAHLTMAEKLAYIGAKRADLWPMALFDSAFDPEKSAGDLFTQRRDIDIIFIGALHLEKMPDLARLKKTFGKRIRMHGFASWKKNLYFNAKFGFPGWITPIKHHEHVPLYQRAKIGLNVHNRGKYTVGSVRLFELPANGVMQISDGGEYLDTYFVPGKEIAGYENIDEAIEKVEYYLTHEGEREEIARAGHDAVLKRHRFKTRMRHLADLIRPHLLSPHDKDGRVRPAAAP